MQKTFKDIKIGETFTTSTGIYIKVSENFARGVLDNYYYQFLDNTIVW